VLGDQVPGLMGDDLTTRELAPLDHSRRSGTTGLRRLGHRLDRPTTGALARPMENLDETLGALTDGAGRQGGVTSGSSTGTAQVMSRGR